MQLFQNSIMTISLSPRLYLQNILPFLFAAIILASCGSTDQARLAPAADEDSHVYYDIDGEIEADEAISAYIQPYIRDMARTMNRVLTVSEGSFERDTPEGTLGNLAADIVRYRATAEMREKVHVSIMNNGGLRVPLPEGEVTVGNIYELMPFENHITVLEFTGEQLLRIADELAGVNGEAVSGIRFRITDGIARDVLVDSSTVDPDSRYWVATNNWMADGGGPSPTLWEPKQRRDLDVMIRDAIIEYISRKETISPYLDNRVRN